MPPAIHVDSAHNLDINEPILNHLKEDYSEFEDWFKKIKLEIIYR
jgi:hypothetical protein